MAAPTGKGSTPVRSLRISDDLWEAVQAVVRDGETATAFFVGAAQAEVAKRNRVANLNHSAAGTDRKPASLTRKAKR